MPTKKNIAQTLPVQVQEAIDLSDKVIMLENRINTIYRNIKQDKPYGQCFTITQINQLYGYQGELIAQLNKFESKFNFILTYFPEHIAEFVNVKTFIFRRKRKRNW